MATKLSKKAVPVKKSAEPESDEIEQLDFDGWEYEEDDAGNSTYDPDD